MRRITFGAIMVASLAIGAILSFSAGASAQDGGSLIIGVSQCPDGYDGQDFPVDCVEPAAGVEFFIGTQNSDNTSSTTSGGDGLATFSLDQFDLDPTGADTVVVGEPATQTGDFAVSCTVNEGEALDFSTEDVPFEPGGPLLGIRFEFETGDDIACEWFRILLPMPGEVEPPGADDDAGAGVEVAELPNTGVGSSSGDSGAVVNALLPIAGLMALTGGALYVFRQRVLV